MSTKPDYNNRIDFEGTADEFRAMMEEHVPGEVIAQGILTAGPMGTGGIIMIGPPYNQAPDKLQLAIGVTLCGVLLGSIMNELPEKAKALALAAYDQLHQASEIISDGIGESDA